MPQKNKQNGLGRHLEMVHLKLTEDTSFPTAHEPSSKLDGVLVFICFTKQKLK